MASYIVTGPDGKKYRVTGPGSKEEALAQVQAKAGAGPAPAEPVDVSGQPNAPAPVATPSPAAAAALDKAGPIPKGGYKIGKAGLQDIINDESAWNKFTAGLGSAVTLPYQSVKQLLSKTGVVDAPSPEDIEAQRAITSTGPGMAGNIAGNIATLAVPSGAAVGGFQKAASFLPQTLKARQVASALAVPAVAAAEGGLLTPTLEGESRAKNAGVSALMAGGMQLGLGGLKRALTGAVKPSPEAAQLMELGIQPTVRQGGTGAMGTAIGGAEDVAANIPGFGKWVKSGATRAHDEMLDVAAKRGLPPGAEKIIPKPGRGEYRIELDEVQKEALNKFLAGKSVKLGGLTKGMVIEDAKKALTRAPDSYGNTLVKDIETIFPKKGASKISMATWKDINDRMTQRATQWAEKFESSGKLEDQSMAEAYKRVGTVLSNLRARSLSPDDVKTYQAIEDAIGHGDILRKSTTYATEGGKDTAAQNLIKAVEASNLKSTLSRGEAKFQDITDPAKAVLEQDAIRDALSRRVAYTAAGAGMGLSGLISPGLALALPATYGLGKLASTHGGAKFLMGGNKWQKDALKLAELLRKGTTVGSGQAAVRIPANIPAGALATLAGTEGQRE